MAAQWVLIHNEDVGRFEVSFPGNNLPDSLPPYIFLSAGGQKQYLRTITRRGASGNELFVSAQAFKGIQNCEVALYSSSSDQRYRLYRLLHDRGQILTLIGLSIALLGLVIEGAIAVGKVEAVFRVSNSSIVISMFAGFALKALGLLIVFFKGILQGDA